MVKASSKSNKGMVGMQDKNKYYAAKLIRESKRYQVRFGNPDSILSMDTTSFSEMEMLVEQITELLPSFEEWTDEHYNLSESRGELQNIINAYKEL